MTNLHPPPTPASVDSESNLGTIRTYSGVKINLLDPNPQDILIEDIAHALANTCRWAGHAKSFYSVAEHSVRAAHFCGSTDRSMSLWALLHDASEAYLCDIPRPVKRLPSMAGYRAIEARMMAVIAERFSLPAEKPERVHLVDRILLAVEARDLFSPDHAEWTSFQFAIDAVRLGDYVIDPRLTLDPEAAKTLFLTTFHRLQAAIGAAMIREATSRRLTRMLSTLSAPHGARARYTAGCRCDDCRRANREYARERAKAHILGDDGTLVSAVAARRHLQMLSRRNVGSRVVADIARLTRSTVRRIRDGQSAHVRRNIEQRILAITPKSCGDAALVDARSTWVIIHDLLEAGYTKRQLAEWLGCTSLQIGRERVTARTAARVAQLAEKIRRGIMRRRT